MKHSGSTKPTGRSTSGWTGWCIGASFLALAAWFVWGPDVTHIPETKAGAVQRGQLSIEPLRQVITDPPTVLIGGFEQGCMDCHRFVQETPGTDRQRTQHTHIALNHGLNDRCFNCHHEADRSKLVLHDGTPIGFDRAEQLCAKCHGPTYRDWQKGMHGKTLGYWNAGLGAQRRLKCTHCHDPHSPAFDAMAPLPGPHTLRMGEPRHAGGAGDHGDSETRNPLRVWSRDAQPTGPINHAEKDHTATESATHD